MNAPEEKSVLRRRAAAVRAGVGKEEREKAAASVAACLIEDPDVKHAISAGLYIAVYLAKDEELDLDLFIRCALDRGARLLAPRWDGKAYSFVPLERNADGFLDVETGRFGVREPRIGRGGGAASRFKPYVIIVPGLAFTLSGDRLGYGGGHYDRLLASCGGGVKTIGVAFGCQILDSLPAEPHDLPLGRVLAVS